MYHSAFEGFWSLIHTKFLPVLRLNSTELCVWVVSFAVFFVGVRSPVYKKKKFSQSQFKSEVSHMDSK